MTAAPHESVSRSNRERSNLSALIINHRMGIDIYAQWKSMTEADFEAQMTGFSTVHGHVGYLREAYHGEPYATYVLMPEAFETGSALISAAALQERLPETLRVAEERQRVVYKETDAKQIDRMLQSYRDFVALCVRKEAEPGYPCLIVASS